MGMQNGAGPLENNLAVSYKVKYICSNLTPSYLPKRSENTQLWVRVVCVVDTEHSGRGHTCTLAWRVMRRPKDKAEDVPTSGLCGLWQGFWLLF